MVAITTIPQSIAAPRARVAPRGRSIDRADGAGARTERDVVERPVLRLAWPVLAVAVAALVAVVLLAGAAPTVGEGGAVDFGAQRIERVQLVEGDSLWSVARDRAPAGEAAAFAHRLAAANPGIAFVPGAVVLVPVA